MELLQEWDAEPVFHLHRPTKNDLERVQSVLKSTYEETYGVSVSSLPVQESNIDPMRIHIRRWIVSWDLQRQGRVIDLIESHVSQVYVTAEDDPDDENDYTY